MPFWFKKNSWPKWLRVKTFVTHPPKPFRVTTTQGKFKTRLYWMDLVYSKLDIKKNYMNGILERTIF